MENMELDSNGMRPMTDEEKAPILNHPKVIIVERPVFSLGGVDVSVNGDYWLSIEDILSDIDKHTTVYLYPPGLRWIQGREDDPTAEPHLKHGYTPRYYTRTRKIK